jgi:hypothetical protein
MDMVTSAAGYSSTDTALQELVAIGTRAPDGDARSALVHGGLWEAIGHCDAGALRAVCIAEHWGGGGQR